MNPRERGFLLLTSPMGDPERPVLTCAQLRTLALRLQTAEQPVQDRDLRSGDLMALGFGRELSERMVALLEEEERLDAYLRKGKALGCVPITRVSPAYPLGLRQKLGLDSPGCLWARGDLDILNTPAISLVGSRELREENHHFAIKVGREAAAQGLTLISGNARGADKAAQDACLLSGGRVISVVADELAKQPLKRNLLYLSEDGFDERFSARRALSRNRCIHGLGQRVFVAQSSLKKGGTWDGTVKNLRFGWTPVACFRDGAESTRQLAQMGAELVTEEMLADLRGFGQPETTFFDP